MTNVKSNKSRNISTKVGRVEEKNHHSKRNFVTEIGSTASNDLQDRSFRDCKQNYLTYPTKIILKPQTINKKGIANKQRSQTSDTVFKNYHT